MKTVVNDGLSLAACFSHVAVDEPLYKCVYGCHCTFEYQPVGLDVDWSMCDNFGSSATHSFSAEQEEYFQWRYAEGYNLLIDPDYVEWLKLNHPESDLLANSSVTVYPGLNDRDEFTDQSATLQSDALGNYAKILQHRVSNQWQRRLFALFLS